MTKVKIPFNKPFSTGNEVKYIRDAIDRGHLSGNGEYTKRCQSWLKENLGTAKALLTHSCTAALEMAAILADVRPGDEIIMPSYTFVSTANAFVLRGGVPVFVDIRPDTLNIDETRIEAAITRKTKAIVPVHYAGVACEMDAIMAIAEKHRVLVIEDAAHAIMSRYKGRLLGSIGHMAALSFHETKNITSGEGGALLINDDRFSERAEVVWEKGTNRSKFFRGEIDKYTWIDIGSSYLPGEITAAFLWAQLEQAETLVASRRSLWDIYHQAMEKFEREKIIRRPFIPVECTHNGHMYHLLLPDLRSRNAFIAFLSDRGIHAVFHYLPLDLSPAGKTYGRTHGEVNITHEISDRVVRVPLWCGLDTASIDHILETIAQALQNLRKQRGS